MDYPVEQHGIRFYHYYYFGIETPIKIEARTKHDARKILDTIQSSLPEKYQNSKIVGESVVKPIRGISEKTTKGVRYIWVGEDRSKNGWMDEDSYAEAISRKR
jgi:hypothetical protein